ncbi:MAG: helix-turn-helix domain-containing protein [Gammaproteobacteria bacterium]|nr:helix-turn-helix domain-containing protein [Gammaproteobacteria bacterium]
MKEKRTYTIETLPVDKTDWKKVAKLSDKEINAAARLDKDARPTTKKQLAKFKRVHSLKSTDIKQIREKLNMSQAVFAAYFGISKRTLQEWEQGRRHPEGPACTLLTVINHESQAVERALMHQ